MTYAEWTAAIAASDAEFAALRAARGDQEGWTAANATRRKITADMRRVYRTSDRGVVKVTTSTGRDLLMFFCVRDGSRLGETDYRIQIGTEFVEHQPGSHATPEELRCITKVRDMVLDWKFGRIAELPPSETLFVSGAPVEVMTRDVK